MRVKPSLPSLLADLGEERRAVRSLVADLGCEAWARPSSPGWTVRDQIAHLAYYDDIAIVAITDPDEFATLKEKALADTDAFERAHLRSVPAYGQPTLIAWDRAAAAFDLVAGYAPPAARVPWFGPDMSVLSMVTARLMETWAHGQDIADALGVSRAATERLRHVAGLAVRARAQGYAVRGLALPEHPVRVELSGPGGDVWAFGPDDAPSTVRGPAEDFCLVQTRRRHVDDTALQCRGDAAREWMEIGQAFAGPPGPDPARVRVSRSGVR
jgi:uncharacterized protein (TIGR03084 family)